MSKSWSQALLCASLAGALAGCSTVPDQAPVRPQAQLPPNPEAGRADPVPQLEPPSRSGNPDTYVVFGKRYRVKETSAGHREVGTASWYGWDFHGRKTSSGPPFNMFELTAAHKSLPIPTYVQVTNLENGRRLVVKVNDRGPFVGERIIDLSYAAAARLDMLDQGTAQVEVVALTPYQFLPTLAARRAEARERIASRAAESRRRQEQIAAIHFAHEQPVAGRTSGKPPAALQEQALRVAKTPSSARESGRSVSTGKIQLASAAPTARPTAPTVKAKAGKASALAAAPVSKAKPTTANKALAERGQSAPRTGDNRAAVTGKGGALYVVGTVTERQSPRQVQNRLSSQMQRSVQVDAGSGKHYEIRVPLRNPGEAKQVAMRLASLGVSRSRVVAD